MTTIRPARTRGRLRPAIAESTSPTAHAHAHGSSLIDGRHGIRAVGLVPRLAPEAWLQHLDGAEARYRSHGFAHVLDRPSLDRNGCALFWNLYRGSALVGGLRAHGPNASSHAYHAVREMRASASIDRLHAMLTAGIPEGVVEVKGAWCGLGVREHRGISAFIARLAVHSARWLRSRFAICTCDYRLVRSWAVSGGRVMDEVAAVEFPDPRFSTVALWWDLRDDNAVSAEVGQLLEEESERLHASSREIEGLA